MAATGTLLATATPSYAAHTDVVSAAGSDTTESLMNTVLNGVPGPEFNIAAQQKTALVVTGDANCSTTTYSGVSRLLQDGNITTGTNILTSATVGFTAADLNHILTGVPGTNSSTTITSVDSGTQVHISQNANATTNPPNTLQFFVYGFGTGSGNVIAPNGSGAGRNALAASVNAAAGQKGCIDIARSSAEPRAIDGTTELASFEYYAYALDDVGWSTTSLNAPAALTLTQLQQIYNCTITNWNQLPGGGTGTIQRVAPQSGSGTGATFINKVLGGANPFNVSNGSCPAVIPVEENHGNDVNLAGTAGYANAILPYSAGKWIKQANNSVNPTLDLRNGVRPGAIYMDGTGADRSTATYAVSWATTEFTMNTSAVNEASVPVSTSNFPGVRYLYNVIDNTSPSYTDGQLFSVAAFTASANSPLCTPSPTAGNKASLIRSEGFLPLAGTSQTTSGQVPVSLGGPGTNPSTACRLNPVTPPPTVTINQAGGQADPASFAGDPSIDYTVVFSQGVTGFDQTDVTVGGTAVGTKSVSVTPIDASHYTVTVTFTALTTPGTVTASIGSNKAVNTFGAGNVASTSTDNTVQLNA